MKGKHRFEGAFCGLDAAALRGPWRRNCRWRASRDPPYCHERTTHVGGEGQSSLCQKPMYRPPPLFPPSPPTAGRHGAGLRGQFRRQGARAEATLGGERLPRRPEAFENSLCFLVVSNNQSLASFPSLQDLEVAVIKASRVSENTVPKEKHVKCARGAGTRGVGGLWPRVVTLCFFLSRSGGG